MSFLRQSSYDYRARSPYRRQTRSYNYTSRARRQKEEKPSNISIIKVVTIPQIILSIMLFAILMFLSNLPTAQDDLEKLNVSIEKNVDLQEISTDAKGILDKAKSSFGNFNQFQGW